MRRRRCRSSVTPRVVESVLVVVCVLGVASLARALEIRVRAGRRSASPSACARREPWCRGRGSSRERRTRTRRASEGRDTGIITTIITTGSVTRTRSTRGEPGEFGFERGGEEIYNALGKTEHRFEFEARNIGELRMCFTNSGGRDASVSYSASLGRQWDHNKAKEQHVDRRTQS